MERQRQKAMALEPTTSLHNNPAVCGQTASGASGICFQGQLKDKGAGRWFLSSSQRGPGISMAFTQVVVTRWEEANHWHPWRNTAFQFIPFHATPDMALFGSIPLHFQAHLIFWQHPCLPSPCCSPQVLDAHLPSPNLHPSGPQRIPQRPHSQHCEPHPCMQCTL